MSYETRRVAALHRLGILDTDPEPRFDRLTALSKQVFGVGKSWIALIDENRQWLKAADGVPADSMPRSDSLCSNVVAANATLVIPDTHADARFRDLPAVKSMGVRFYAGALLRSADGLPLGTLCIADDRPRTLSESELNVLIGLAEVAQEELLRTRERLDIKEEILQNAFSDSLTDLPDGAYATALLSRYIRDEMICAVAVVSIDHRDRILQAHGHQAMERIIREIAARLRDLNGDHTLAYNAEHGRFLILHQHVQGPTQALGALEQVCKEGSGTQIIDGAHIPIRLRAGLAFSETLADQYTATDCGIEHSQCAEALVDMAGRARPADTDNPLKLVGLESAQTGEDMRSWLDLSTRLNDPALTDQLHLVYQPKVNAQTHTVAGFEALVRWIRPDGVFVSPGQFIPIAEETGAIGMIGQWVAETAAARLLAWKAEQPDREIPPVAINIGAPHLLAPDFEDSILALTDGLGLPRCNLHLELTESAVLSDMKAAITVLSRLRSLGFHIALDDFGTGYSSLGYLQDIPAHALKLDKSFIDDLAKSRRQRTLVKAIIRLAQALDMVVIGEGVETPDQFRILKEMGCDQIQGYLFSKPLPVEDASGYALGRQGFFDPLAQ